MTTYCYSKKRKSKAYHIGDLSQALCRMHHSTCWKNVTEVSETPPQNKKLCTNCQHVRDTGKQPEIRPKRPQPSGFLNTVEWKTVRYMALKQSNGACCLCGRGASHGVVLNVDHIKPRRTHPHLALDVSNLQVLCSACNHGKGNWDSTDWR